MIDQRKTKAQLLTQVQRLQRRIFKLEKKSAANLPECDAGAGSPNPYHIKILQVQRDLALAVNRAKTLTEMLELCLQTAIDIADMDCGGVYLLNETAATLELVCHKGLSKPFIKQVARFDAQSLSFKTVMTGKPLFSEYSEITDRLRLKRRETLHAAAIIPIMWKGRVIASFNVASHTRNRIETSAQLVLESIAAQIGEYINRARAEKALKHSEGQLRMILENTIDMITLSTFDSQLTCIYVNQSIKHLLGYDPQDFIGRSAFDFTHPKDHRTMARVLNKHLKLKHRLKTNVAANATETVEFRFRKTTGEWRCMQSKVTLVNDQLLAVTRDITDYKRGEEVLVAQRDLAKAIGHAKSIEEGLQFSLGIALTVSGMDSGGIYLYEPAHRTLKLSVHQGLGDEFVAAVSVFPADSSNAQTVLAGHTLLLSRDEIPEAEPYRKENLRCMASVPIFFQEHSVGCLNIASHSLTHLPASVLGSLEVIAAEIGNLLVYLQAETALRASEERYRQLFELSPDGIVILDPDTTRFLEFNEKACAQLGYSRDEFACLALSDIEVDETPGDILNHIRSIQKGERCSFEARHRTKQGSLRDIRVSARPLHLHGRSIYYCIWRDITEYKFLESQLRQSQKMEAIGQLAGGIAHDFNNILSPILGYADMALQSLPHTDPLFADLQQVLSSARRAKHLVAQILVFAKKNEIRLEPLLLQSVIEEALQLLRPSIPSSVRIDLQVADHCEKVCADATQMHQVIVNLCNNAWQAMEATGGTLTIALSQTSLDHGTAGLLALPSGEYVRLSVTDTGPGMDEQTKGRIFEPFFTTKAINKGTGLGLSVVHGIVHNHRGNVAVESKAGKGSAFHIYLPIIKDKALFPHAEDNVVISGKGSVLIVDDEEAVAMVVKKMLEKLGYQAAACTSALDALKTFHQHSATFDLLISDLTMPHLSGLELAAQVRKVHPDLPLILMTGYGNTISEEIKASHGIRQVINKPVTISELAAAVHSLLE